MSSATADGQTAAPVTVQGVRVPRMIYGTAWKEDRTASLTAAALKAGFRGVDTANQRRHYVEAAVGEAIQASGIAREGLFVQTKFTSLHGQDHRLPYDPQAPLGTQVEQSMASSLAHLGVAQVDAYLLHGPASYPDLAEEDLETWGAMERLHREGTTRLLGLSNVTLQQVREIHDRAGVKPALVQNRTFTRPNADREVRAFCKDHGMVYEGFSLLTARPGVLRQPAVVEIAARLGRTPAQLVVAYCLEQGMTVLTGTTSAEHMAQDLDAATIRLAAEDRRVLDELLS